MEVSQLTHMTKVVTNSNQAALITFKNNRPADIGEVKSFTAIDKKGVKSIKQWGSDNRLPNYRKHILMDNNIMGSLIESKAAIVIGHGISAYVDVYEGEGAKRKRVKVPVPMPDEVQQWLDLHDVHDNYLQSAAYQLLMHNNAFVSLMPDRKRSPNVGSIKSYGCEYVRAVKEKNKEVIGYLHHPNWEKPTAQEGTFAYFPRYDKTASRLEHSMMHIGYGAFHDGVYWHPSYWGGKEWIELSNEIPKFHKANILNGYTVRVHIEIPQGYFLDKSKYQDAQGNDKKMKKCIAKAEQAEQEFLDTVNSILAGADNAGRAVITTKRFMELSKMWEGITITPINLDMKDEALLKLFDKSNDANIASMDIHPSIANVQTQGKLSSGSEMRNAINIYIKYKTPIIRTTLLKPIKEVMRINGWDRYIDKASGEIIKYRIEDTMLETLDDAPTGTSTPAEEN